MTKFSCIIFIGLLILFTSCRKDFSTVASSGNLEFSKTTVYLDTVFSTIGSSTYSLKVYNRSNDAIKIPTIQLAKGLNSKYRMIVDGMSGNNKIFENVELLAKDSLYIFIETTANIADANPTDFIYNDKILFDNGAKQQSVDLVTMIQDCNFIFPNRSLDKTIYEKITVQGFDPDTQGHTLITPQELHWTNAKPYVIYGNILVPNGQTLIIDPGTQVYFHDGSTLIVETNATLDIQGNLNVTDASGKIITRNEVTFEGDRLEPEYEDVPGQWGTVFLFSANNNKVNYLKLKNAIIGFYMIPTISSTNFPKLEITNSQIYNCSFYGILAQQSVILGKNVVMNYAGQACFAGTIGGNYDFTHCTFNNNWNSTKQQAVYINNYITDKNDVPIAAANLNASFKNSIIYGSNNIEFVLDKKEVTGYTTTWTTVFDKCLIKFNDPNNRLINIPEYNSFRNVAENYLNENPSFININNNNLRVPNNSFVKNKGNAIYSTFSDILQQSRSASSDIGAYNVNP